MEELRLILKNGLNKRRIILEFYLKNENNLTIYFDEKTKSQLSFLLQNILNNLKICMQIKFIIIINGLETTIDTFLDSCISNDYFLYDNNYYKKFIKYLPTLYLISDYIGDIKTFFNFIGAFNEGVMNLIIIEDSITDLHLSKSNIENIKQLINNDYLIEFRILPDGDTVEINTKSSLIKLRDIINYIEKCLTTK